VRVAADTESPKLRVFHRVRGRATVPRMSAYMDEDAVMACVELVGRTGAKDFEIGYLRDEETEGHPVAIEDAGWYAKCTVQGHILAAEEAQGPSEAADGLSRRILTGGQCTHCKQTITLKSGPGCRWRRMGSHWERGCIPEPLRYGARGSGRSGAFR
jgi:hypothetical protein